MALVCVTYACQKFTKNILNKLSPEDINRCFVYSMMKDWQHACAVHRLNSIPFARRLLLGMAVGIASVRMS